MIEQSEQKNQLYQVVRVYKNSDKKQILHKNLTEAEAQNIVKIDIKNNPKASENMLIYQLQNQT